MRTSSMGYLVKEGTKNVWFNRLMSLASVGVLTACLILLGFAILLAQNLSQVITVVENQNEAIFFLYDSATQEQIYEFELQLKNEDNINDIKFISKEQALEDSKKQYGAILEGLEGDENPLPASFRVSVKDLTKFNETIDKYSSVEIIEDIEAPDDMASTLVRLRQLASVSVSAIIIALAIVSLIVIINSINASVYSRKREINIMKFVGATDNFIRLPFVVEGIIIGLISAILAFFTIMYGYNGLLNVIDVGNIAFLAPFYNSLIPFATIWGKMLALFCVSGMAVGAIASIFSIRKHLKV